VALLCSLPLRERAGTTAGGPHGSYPCVRTAPWQYWTDQRLLQGVEQAV